MLGRAATAPQKAGERARFVLLAEGEDVCVPFLHPSRRRTTATLLCMKRCMCVKESNVNTSQWDLISFHVFLYSCWLMCDEFRLLRALLFFWTTYIVYTVAIFPAKSLRANQLSRSKNSRHVCCQTNAPEILP